MPRELEIACGKLLRQKRERVGISQEKLAELAELDRSYVSIVERGRKSLTLATFCRLCAALGLVPENVLGMARRSLDADGESQGARDV